jgi:cobalamin biosynthesis Mg chelatase CobN
MSMAKITGLLLFLSGFAGMCGAQPVQITGFTELMESLHAGERVRVVMQYSLCAREQTGSETDTIPGVAASLEIDTWEYFDRGSVGNAQAFVVFSQSKLIENPLGKGYVLNYGKVKIREDNSVKVTARYLHPKTLRVKMEEFFRCAVNDGRNRAGIYLFKNQ